jgi:hypothetical protein
MIATLPPSNHITALRSFIRSIRRTRAIPSQQEFAHAEEQLRALEEVVKNVPAS